MKEESGEPRSPRHRSRSPIDRARSPEQGRESPKQEKIEADKEAMDSYSASLRLAAPLDDVRCAGLTDVTPARATADCCRGLVSDSDDVGYIDTHLHITKINDILHINLHSSFLINKAGQLMTDQCSQPFIILYDLNQPSSGQGLLTSLMTPPKSNKQETLSFRVLFRS